MGRDKALLDAGGRPLIQRVVERLAPFFPNVAVVLAGPEPHLSVPGVAVISDLHPGHGPISGIHAALSWAPTGWVFVMACDMPLVAPRLLQYMALLRPGHEAVAPEVRGYLEPLHAFYRKTLLGTFEDCIRRGAYGLQPLLQACRLRRVRAAEIARFDPEHRSFTNVNTPKEWDAVRQAQGWDDAANS
ncbi:MAG: molybdenum cofactor guanylyltransferase [Anaerolineae bacterium]